jgi:lysophospholipase L1-like esterase
MSTSRIAVVVLFLVPAIIGCTSAPTTQELNPLTPMNTNSPMKSGPIVYVALGDSTGVGQGANNGGYVDRMFRKLEVQRPGSRLRNLCVSGATTIDVVSGQLDEAIAANPDLVTLGVGINDIGHGLSLQEFARNYQSILDRLKKATHAIVVVTNIPDISSAPRIPSAMRMEYQRTIDQFNLKLQEIATTTSAVIVFDIYTITRQQLTAHPEFFSADGFHPSDAGYEMWAEQMWPTLVKVISSE